jgi:hypothetical protein
MKRALLLISITVFFSCEEADTTPPSVSIISPQDSAVVNKIADIACMAADNDEVKVLELWIDGVFSEVSDNSEPFSLPWNTTTYENRSYTIIVRAYDVSDNVTDSSPRVLTVDNSQSVPLATNINSITYGYGGLTINWKKSIDDYFYSYSLEKSLHSNMSQKSEVFSATELGDTVYVDGDIDPLVYQYYRIIITDEFGYSSSSSIRSSLLDPIPSPVDVESVINNTLGMVITWEQSIEGDFLKYELHQSDGNSTDFSLITTITDINIYQHILTEFDPFQKHYFRVTVFDTLDQYSVGNHHSSEIAQSPPSPILDVVPYNSGAYQLTWSMSQESDFSHYTVFYSTDDAMEGSTIIYSSENIESNSFAYDIPLNPNNFFMVSVSNVFQLESFSNIAGGWGGYVTFMTTFGGVGNDYGYSVQQANDGGYIVACAGDNWLIKTDSHGNQEWAQSSSDTTHDTGNAVGLTLDGGYIIAGETFSYSASDNNVWLTKVNSVGNEEWSRSFGGSTYDIGFSTQPTNDGGYIVVGITGSFGNGLSDVWLIKTDSQGNEEWNYTFGGSLYDRGYSVQQTDDGGFIICGNTESFGSGEEDIWLIKTNSDGIQEWNQTFGGSEDDSGYSVQQTTDGGFIITGYTKSSENGTYKLWLIKTNSSGSEEWSQTYGNFYSFGRSIQQTIDGGYIICGRNTNSANTPTDAWLLKTDSQGVVQWEKNYGGDGSDQGYSAQQASDGGYVLVGKTRADNGFDDVILLKTNPNGDLEF